MSTVYLTKLNEFSHKFLLKGSYQPTREDVMLFQQRFDKIKSSIFESLLLHETINIKVVGENIPLAVLISDMGVNGVEELIDQNGLCFTHWTPVILHFVDDIDGVIPLLSGRHNSQAHCDPEESIAIGLKSLTSKLNKKERKIIIRKTRDLYSYPEENIEHKAKDYALSAFNSNKLLELGLDNTKHDIYKLPASLKLSLSRCAENLLEYKHLTNEKLTSTDNQGIHSIFQDCSEKLIKAKHSEAFSKIVELEQFPNLQDVYSYLDSPLRRIGKIRNTKNIKKFRSWLDETTDSNELADISKAYIDAIASKKGFFDTGMGKFTKTVIMGIAGAGVGAVAGPVGLAVGGVTGAAVAPAADFGFDLIDEYFLSGLLKGWSPKMFIEELRALNVRVDPTI